MNENEIIVVFLVFMVGLAIGMEMGYRICKGGRHRALASVSAQARR